MGSHSIRCNKQTKVKKDATKIAPLPVHSYHPEADVGIALGADAGIVGVLGAALIPAGIPCSSFDDILSQVVLRGCPSGRYDAHRHTMLLEQRLRQHFGNGTLINIHLEPLKINGLYPV